MKYPNNLRNQKIITNGMDENLVHLNDWGKVFNNKKL